MTSTVAADLPSLVGFAALASAFRYLSQASFGKDFSKDRKTADRVGRWLRIVAVVGGVASLLAFFFGIYLAYEAIPI